MERPSLILTVLFMHPISYFLPIQSHANIDLITFDTLNSYNVQKLIQERDRLEFAHMRRRHTLRHQIHRTQWSVLFQILRLHSHMCEL